MELQTIGDPSGRKSGWAQAGDKRFEVFEKPVTGLQKRPDYRQSLIEKHGNPNVSEDAISNQISGDFRRNEAALFDYVFGGRRDFNTRNDMDLRARNVWRKATEQYRKKRDTAIRSDLQSVRGRIDVGMKDYDSSMKPKAGLSLRTGLTPSQKLKLNQDVYKVKKDANKAYGEDPFTLKPIKPANSKDMPKYRKSMQAWTVGQIANEYKEMKKYYPAVYGESGGEKADKEYGNKLYKMYLKITDNDEKKAFLQNLQDNYPDLNKLQLPVNGGATGKKRNSSLSGGTKKGLGLSRKFGGGKKKPPEQKKKPLNMTAKDIKALSINEYPGLTGTYKKKPSESIIEKAQKFGSQTQLNKRFGEGAIGHALRTSGIEDRLEWQKEIERKLKKLYPNTSEADIVKMIASAAGHTKIVMD